MEAILEARRATRSARTKRGGRGATARCPAVLYGGDGKRGDGDRRRAEGAAQDPALRVGREHAHLAEAGGRRRHARAGQGLPARSGHAPVLHADFYRVAMDRLLQVTMPVTVKGEPKGVKQQGGILEFIRREIVIECLPADIPEHVEIDVTELMLHQGIRVRDVAANAKWKPVSDADIDAGPRHPCRRPRKSRRRRTAAARRRRRRPSPKSSRRARRTKRATRRTRRRPTAKKDEKKK